MATLDDLFKRNVPVRVDYRGEHFTVYYDPADMTDEKVLAISRRTKRDLTDDEEDATETTRQVFDYITGWDVMLKDGKERAPFDLETIKRLPNDCKLAMLRAVNEDLFDPNQGRPSKRG